MIRRAFLGFGVLALLGVALGSAHAIREEPDEGIRLVLLLVVDQLRPDRLHAELPGGLGRLVREGRVFTDAVLAHALTETCPGHVSMVAGRHPGPAGVPANRYIDRAASETRYCVGDPSEDARVFGGQEGEGRSPRALRVTTLGDWLKAAHPGARVYSVSGKDRAAITMGGKGADAAFWFDRRDPPGFTTSRYYLGALPTWVEEWSDRGGGVLARLPERWEHATGAPANAARRDDYPFEAPIFRRTSGHPVRETPPRSPGPAVYFTPFLDEITLDFARTLVEKQGLGRGPGPDLLAVAPSATDTVGHLYGPFSQEARDALHRLDAAVGDFLSFLERAVGSERLLVVLTADHGVLPLPEWLAETGRSACPVPGGRIDVRALQESLLAKLHEELDPAGTATAPWLLQSGSMLSVNRAVAEQRGVTVERVAGRLRELLAAEPGIARVWTAEELSKGEGPEPYASLFRRSFDPERSGDLLVQPAADCLLSPFPTGTSHGSPHLYDRAVPLVFFGAGVGPGGVRAPAATVDIAPTVAAELGLPIPGELDGRVLSLQSDPAGL